MTICLALDLALTRSGAAWTASAAPRCRFDSCKPKLKGPDRKTRPALDRAIEIAEWVGTIADMTDPAFAIVESPSFGSKFAQKHKLGEQRGLALAELHRRGIPFIDCAPSKRMVMAIGQGKPVVEGNEKAEIIEACHNAGIPVANSDEGDAVAHLCVGLELVNVVSPFGIVGPERRRAIKGLELPPGVAERIESRRTKRCEP